MPHEASSSTLRPGARWLGLDAIIAYAEKHNCVVRLSELRHEASDPPSDDNSQYDEDEPLDDHEPWGDGTDPRWPDVLVNWTITDAIEVAMREIGFWHDGVPRFQIECTNHRPHLMIVSLFANYDLNRRTLPSQEVVERLAETLGLETRPKYKM